MISKGRIVAAALSLVSASAGAQEATPVPVPLFQPATEFGPTVASIKPHETTMTAAEEASLRTAISTMEAFPPYLFSGCHDRAHAAHMLLPAALQPKVMKIWIMAPGRYTAVLPGLLGLKGSGAATEVSWGHHVALAFRGANGELRVVDPVLRPRDILTETQWFALMNVPRMTLWTLTRGELYLFEASNLNPPTVFAGYVWNGRPEVYEPRWIPGNIARDAVGVDATAGTACAEVVQRRKDPWGLLTFLEKGQAAAPPACRPSVAKFEQLRGQWSSKLGIPLAAAPTAPLQARNH